MFAFASSSAKFKKLFALSEIDVAQLSSTSVGSEPVGAGVSAGVGTAEASAVLADGVAVAEATNVVFSTSVKDGSATAEPHAAHVNISNTAKNTNMKAVLFLIIKTLFL
jgi:hypothetical protein